MWLATSCHYIEVLDYVRIFLLQLCLCCCLLCNFSQSTESSNTIRLHKIASSFVMAFTFLYKCCTGSCRFHCWTLTIHSICKPKKSRVLANHETHRYRGKSRLPANITSQDSGSTSSYRSSYSSGWEARRIWCPHPRGPSRLGVACIKVQWSGLVLMQNSCWVLSMGMCSTGSQTKSLLGQAF